MQRWRVLLIHPGGDAVDGHFDHVSDELPIAGEIIDVRNRRDRGAAVIRARVERVDPESPLPIAAVVLRREVGGSWTVLDETDEADQEQRLSDGATDEGMPEAPQED